MVKRKAIFSYIFWLIFVEALKMWLPWQQEKMTMRDEFCPSPVFFTLLTYWDQIWHNNRTLHILSKPGDSDWNLTRLLSNKIRAANTIPEPFRLLQLQSFCFFDCLIFSFCKSIDYRTAIEGLCSCNVMFILPYPTWGDGGGGGGGGGDSTRPRIVFFIIPVRDAAKQQNLVTFPKT